MGTDVKPFTVEGMVIVPVGMGLNDPMTAAQRMAEERTKVEGPWYMGYRIALWGHGGDYQLQYVTGRVLARRADGWETLRTLYLGIFGGWLRETQWRVDRERLPFFRWVGKRLSYFLPIGRPLKK